MEIVDSVLGLTGIGGSGWDGELVQAGTEEAWRLQAVNRISKWSDEAIESRGLR